MNYPLEDNVITSFFCPSLLPSFLVSVSLACCLDGHYLVPGGTNYFRSTFPKCSTKIDHTLYSVSSIKSSCDNRPDYIDWISIVQFKRHGPPSNNISSVNSRMSLQLNHHVTIDRITLTGSVLYHSETLSTVKQHFKCEFHNVILR